MILGGIKLMELASGAAKKWLRKQMDSSDGSIGASIDREKGEATFFQGDRKGEFKKAGGSLEYMEFKGSTSVMLFSPGTSIGISTRAISGCRSSLSILTRFFTARSLVSAPSL